MAERKIRFFWDGTYGDADRLSRSDEKTGPRSMSTGSIRWMESGNGTIRCRRRMDTAYIQDLSGESFFLYTGNDSATFYYTPPNVYGEADGEHAGEEGDAADLEYMTQIPEIHEKIMQGMSLYEEEPEEIDECPEEFMC